jgi:hypothetical protein
MIQRVARLLLGLCVLVSLAVGLDCFGGEVSQIQHNRQLDVEVDAYFYSEVGGLEEFLDKSGRYWFDR